MLLDRPHHHDIFLRCSAYRALRLVPVGILHNGRCLRQQTLPLYISRSESAWSHWYKIQPDSFHIFLRRDGMFQGSTACKLLVMFPADRILQDTRDIQLVSQLNPGTFQQHSSCREFPLLRLDIFRSGCSLFRGCSLRRRSSCNSVGCLCWCSDPGCSLCMFAALGSRCIFQGYKESTYSCRTCLGRIRWDSPCSDPGCCCL